MKFKFTKEQSEYIYQSMELSLRSLLDCCDNKGRVTVNFISQKDADNEFKMLRGIMEELTKNG